MFSNKFTINHLLKIESRNIRESNRCCFDLSSLPAAAIELASFRSSKLGFELELGCFCWASEKALIRRLDDFCCWGMKSSTNDDRLAAELVFGGWCWLCGCLWIGFFEEDGGWGKDGKTSWCSFWSCPLWELTCGFLISVTIIVSFGLDDENGGRNSERKSCGSSWAGGTLLGSSSIVSCFLINCKEGWRLFPAGICDSGFADLCESQLKNKFCSVVFWNKLGIGLNNF